MTGISHEYEPEADSIVYIDFEDEQLPESNDEGDNARYAWMEAAITQVAEATGALVDDILAWGVDIDEERLWSNVEDRVNEAGFDTYNSDTRFEVFPAGTPGLKREVEDRYTPEEHAHLHGEHDVESDVECPLCREVIEAGES